ncbi:MAG: hypothetical protein ACRDZY_16880 [Acidimicrobiales bacterium]
MSARILWRVGRTLGRTLYQKMGQDPLGDLFLGHARTRQFADQAINTINLGQRPEGGRWWCSGGLVCNHPGANPTRDWIIALDSPADAALLVATANGPDER